MGKVLIQVSASEEARAAAQADALLGKPLILPHTNLAEEHLPREEPKPAAQGSSSASKEAGSNAEAETVSRKKVGDCHGLHALRLVSHGRGVGTVLHNALPSLPGHALEVRALECCNVSVGTARRKQQSLLYGLQSARGFQIGQALLPNGSALIGSKPCRMPLSQGPSFLGRQLSMQTAKAR